MPKQNKKTMHRVPFYRRPIVVALCLVVVILIAVVVFLIVKAVSGDNSQSEDVVDETENVLVYSEDTGDEENDLSPEDQKVIMQYEGDNPNELDYLTGLITYTEVKNGSLVAMVSIDQYLSDGVCVASLKNGSYTVTSVEELVEADASTSHCAIEVNLAGINGGKYQLEVVISSGNKTGTLTSDIEL